MNQARKRTPPPPVRRKPPVTEEHEPLQKPNVADPLSEPTRHRRVWAAYLRAGLTRHDFADRLNTNYHTVCRWDTGAAAMNLDALERASRIVGYSMDELCFGHAGAPAPAPATPPPSRREVPLTDAEIRELFDRQHVPAATRAAFGEHTVSPAGRYQTFTAAYVEAWCAAHAQTGDGNQALQSAVSARAVTEAVAAGVTPITREALRGALSRS